MFSKAVYASFFLTAILLMSFIISQRDLLFQKEQEYTLCGSLYGNFFGSFGVKESFMDSVGTGLSGVRDESILPKYIKELDPRCNDAGTFEGFSCRCCTESYRSIVH